MRRATPPVLLLLLIVTGRGTAQDWQPGSAVELVRRAAAHRAARDADTLLSTWQAEAHGIIRSASVLDHGDGPVERVIRADELRVEVYGEAPNRSKQIIRAWRDTSFLPNRINYHRDHLGIVANDFGPMIRLGQGEEVRDVPHPLSAAGLAAYQFAVGDTVTIRSPRGRTRVVTVRVRPANPDSSGTVGTLYLDADRAALVRFDFTFTPASYRDATVEAITVTLENGLQEGTRWLPWRQSIVIRRGLPFLDLPIRTVIRGDWTIDNYELGVQHPPDRFLGPFLVGPRGPQAGGVWQAPLALQLDALPATGADVAAVEQAASASLDGGLLDGLPRFRLLAGGISDLIQVNRVEGVTPAIGTRLALGGAFTARGRIGIGLSDQRVIGSASLEHASGATSWRVWGERTVRDIADAPVISGFSNSLGTAISGEDYGDYSLTERLGLQYLGDRPGLHIALSLDWESVSPVDTAFTPLSGSVRANPDLGRRDGMVSHATMSNRNPRGDGWTLVIEGNGRWRRAAFSANGRVTLPTGALLLSGTAGIGSSDLPPDRNFVLGGRSTLLGVPFRALGGRRMALAEVAWAIPVAVPTPPVPFSRLIHLPSVLAPYLAAGVAGGDVPGQPWRGTGQIEPVAGLRLDLWGPLIRLDAGVSLRTGGVGLSFDLHPDWWGVM